MAKVISVRIDHYNRIVVCLKAKDRHDTGLREARWIAVPDSDGTFYYAINGDVVHYLYHNPKNETGYGGRVYDLTMEDGSIHYVKGPWSARNGVLHAFVPTLDVVGCITEGLVVCNVRKESLEKFGLRFKVKLSSGEKTWELAECWRSCGPFVS